MRLARPAAKAAHLHARMARRLVLGDAMHVLRDPRQAVINPSMSIDEPYAEVTLAT